MAGNPAAFGFMYKVEMGPGGTFTVVDGDADSTNGLTPAASDVIIKDDIQDGPRERHSVVGDVADDHFHVTQGGGANGVYSFTFLAAIDSANGFIAMNEAGDYFFFTNDQLDDAQAGQPIDTSDGELQVCFMPGTMIRTPTGDVAVELLASGDLVATADGRAVPVRWIGRQTVAPRFGDGLRMPIRVKAGALGDNVPSRDLRVSPDHALFVGGALIHASALVNGASIVRETDVPAIFTYYHVEVDDHSLILAEGTPAETFIDNVDRGRFDNWAEFEALYPEGRDMAEMAYPRAKAHRQVPAAIRVELDRRAASLLAAVGQAA